MLSILSCEVFGIPSPTVTWLFEGTTVAVAVPPSDTIGGNVTVTYVVLDPEVFNPEEFEGSYTCTGTNSLGTVSRTLQVQEKCEYLCCTHYCY